MARSKKGKNSRFLLSSNDFWGKKGEEKNYAAIPVSFEVLVIKNQSEIKMTPKLAPAKTTHFTAKLLKLPRKIAGNKVARALATNSVHPGRAFIFSRMLPINKSVLK
ncbi:MAG TPA: hypothetical protein ENN58_02315 [bacterium]|nr:hypothetical protein [bacterium]